jgi:hypothetical protein
METTNLGARVREILDGGGGEAAGELRFLPLVTLDSEARYGLDAEARWIIVPAEGPVVRYEPATAHLFHEALEWKRDRFDDAIEESARAGGLPPIDVVFSFPAVDVVRAVLAKEHAYLTRIALQWIRPTELRELRAAIKAVALAPNMPLPVKDLAERLIVPE